MLMLSIKSQRSKDGTSKSYPGFDAAVNAVQSGQADAIMAVNKTKERENVHYV